MNVAASRKRNPKRLRKKTEEAPSLTRSGAFNIRSPTVILISSPNHQSYYQRKSNKQRTSEDHKNLSRFAHRSQNRKWVCFNDSEPTSIGKQVDLAISGPGCTCSCGSSCACPTGQCTCKCKLSLPCTLNRWLHRKFLLEKEFDDRVGTREHQLTNDARV